MGRKVWKKLKKTGGIKRKVLKEYQSIISSSTRENITSSESRISANEHARSSQVFTTQNVEGSVNINICPIASSVDSNHENININPINIDSSDSSESDEEKCCEFENNIAFRENISQWAVEKNISHEALKSLSSILNERFPAILPRDPRTILNTARSIHLKTFEGGQGEYWQNNIADSLLKLIQNWNNIPDCISLNINIDGLPIYKSSKKEFWPILCNVFEHPGSPFIIGIYFGTGKPKDLNKYFEDFITEMDPLLKDGLLVNHRNVKVKIRCFICDSPARAFIKGVCNFNGKHGCLKCTTVGEYSHNSHTVVFPDSRCSDRTDEGFRRKLYGSHHKSDSPLLKLQIDMVQDFPVADSLHLIDLGVMKRLLMGWRDGNFGKYLTKWCSRDIDKVMLFLSKCKLPTEIHRAVRGIDCLAHWKGSEFRSFFFYLSIIILPDVLTKETYSHFVSLYSGITICSDANYQHLLPLAKELLLHFVEHYKHFYGADYVTSNVHNIVHIVDEVRKFGPLHTFNAYPFENKLYLIKKMLRGGNRPLVQVAKRFSEESVKSEKFTKEPKTLNEPFIHKRNRIIVQFDTFQLSTKIQDKYCRTRNKDIVEIKNIFQRNNATSIHVCKISSLQDVFTRPIRSSFFNIFKATLPLNNPEFIITYHDIEFKFVGIEHNNELYLIPLLHTL